MKIAIIISVVLITAIQALSPLSITTLNTRHQEELPNDGNSENEIKELQELETEEIITDNIVEIINSDANNNLLFNDSELKQQIHKALPVLPPEQN